MLIAEPVQWEGREAIRLWNHAVELVVAGGGHLASFRYLDQKSNNVPKTYCGWLPDPTRPGLCLLGKICRPLTDPWSCGKFSLAGFTGHGALPGLLRSSNSSAGRRGPEPSMAKAAVELSRQFAPKPTEGCPPRATAHLPYAQLNV